MAHAQVTVTAVGLSAEVDAGMAPLIEALWRRSIFTTNSCEDDAGMCWVQFASSADLQSFLTALLRRRDCGPPPCGDCLQCRVAQVGTRPFDPVTPDRWHYRIHPATAPVGSVLQGGLQCRFGVWFPKSDLPGVTAAMA